MFSYTYLGHFDCNRDICTGSESAANEEIHPDGIHSRKKLRYKVTLCV